MVCRSRAGLAAACASLVLSVLCVAAVGSSRVSSGATQVASVGRPAVVEVDPGPAFAAVEQAELDAAQARYLAELHRRATAVQARTAPIRRDVRVAAVAAPTSLGPCGGDLPPCWVKKRESGGDYRIWNRHCYAPIGYAGSRSPCGGSTASGGWQILRSTWGHVCWSPTLNARAEPGAPNAPPDTVCYLNAADAPPNVQDARARELWAECPRTAHWGTCRG